MLQLEALAYSAFWDLVHFDGMGGVHLPYADTVAWLDEQEVQAGDRSVYRRLWRSMLAVVRKDRADRAKKDEEERGAKRRKR